MRFPDSFWAVIGKISAVVTIAAALFGLWAHYSSPHTDLVGELHYGRQFWPPDAREEEVTNLLDPKKLAKEALEGTDADKASAVKQAVTELVLRLRQEVVKSDFGRYTTLGGYWLVDVRNEGDLPATDITITLPFSRLAVVVSGDELKEVPVDSGTLGLGSLRPKAKLTVVAWTMSEPTPFELKDVVLSHKNGVGDLEIYDLQRPLAVLFSQSWIPIIFVVSNLTIAGVILFQVVRQYRRPVTLAARTDDAHLREGKEVVMEQDQTR